jgi:hypothetical protein
LFEQIWPHPEAPRLSARPRRMDASELSPQTSDSI